jgi:hypothetical protein
MTIEELDNYLGARGMQLDYVRSRSGYRWLVSQASDAARVCEGHDPDVPTMVGHILATPLPDTDVLIGQLLFDFGPAVLSSS